MPHGDTSFRGIGSSIGLSINEKDDLETNQEHVIKPRPTVVILLEILYCSMMVRRAEELNLLYDIACRMSPCFSSIK